MKKWITKEAKWYQFWLPRSGFIGGLILASIFVTLFYLIEG